METSIETIKTCYEQPFFDLLYQAHTTHRQYHPLNQLQKAALLSIKTGTCPENCGYCSQSAHHTTHVEKEGLFTVEKVVESACKAKEMGATRFCMGAAWRVPPEKEMPKLLAMVKAVKALGLETCMTLGMLTTAQAEALKTAGLDFYNHNIDTSPQYYAKVVTTRTMQDRLDTLQKIRDAGIKVCCGGILGLGESRQDRIEMLHVLANLQEPPESLPINYLIRVEGTPLGQQEPVIWHELVRTIATARIIMPKSVVRLTAGRISLSDELQALCFFAGASSVHIGDILLTEENPTLQKDNALFQQLGLTC